MKDYFIKGFQFRVRDADTKVMKLNNRFPINIISIQIRTINDNENVTIVDQFDYPIGYCSGRLISKVIYPNIVVQQDTILKITLESDTCVRLVGERVAISPDT